MLPAARLAGRLLAVVALGGALAALLPAVAEGSDFRACPRLKGRVGFDCATVHVPLDRSGLTPGTVGLHVEVLRGQGFRASPPVVALSGGPGESSSAYSLDFAQILGSTLAARDLVVFDQRGTGLSGALRCWPFASLDIRTERESREAVGACGASLGPRAAHYTTSDTVDDIEAVREAVGADRIALFAVSYGTKVALQYAARYPEHVERLVLDSVVPPDGPHVFWRSSLAAVPRVLRAVCARGCPFTTDPVADLRELVHTLEGGPLTGSVVRGDGRRHPARIGRADLFALLLSGDFDPAVRAALPPAIRSAAAGDLAPLLRLREDQRGFARWFAPPRFFSSALYVATLCGDSALPWTPGAPTDERIRAAHAYVQALPPSDFGPFDATTALAVGQLPLCVSWPVVGPPPSPIGPLPDVPALIATGTHDLRTPMEDAYAVAASLPQARVLPVRGVGHSVLSRGLACAERAVDAFLAGRGALGCPGDRGPVPDPVPPVSLARVGPAGAPLRSRVLAAAVLTVEDAVSRLPVVFPSRATWAADGFFVRAGGLRSGRVSASPRMLTLERLVYVPGVTVDGRIEGRVDPLSGLVTRAHGTLRVRGPGVSGVLSLSKGRVIGTVGGAQVELPLSLGRE